MSTKKVVDADQLDTDLTSVANSIRSKGGTSGKLEFPDGFVSAVNGIVLGTNTSDATAGVYDICENKTAYVNGSKVTGKYVYTYAQANSSSTNCSSSILVFPCRNFKPSAISVMFNSSQKTSGIVVAMQGHLWAVSYQCLNSSSVLSKTESSTNISTNFWWYSDGYVHVKVPSGYKWHSYNYKCIMFR